MHIHYAFVLDRCYELCEQIVKLVILILFFDDHSLEVVRLDNSLHVVWQPGHEVVQSVFVFGTPLEMILELRVVLIALIAQLRVVLECLVRVVKETVQALEVPLHVLFHTLSLAFPLLPNLHLSLEV